MFETARGQSAGGFFHHRPLPYSPLFHRAVSALQPARLPPEIAALLILRPPIAYLRALLEFSIRSECALDPARHEQLPVPLGRVIHGALLPVWCPVHHPALPLPLQVLHRAFYKLLIHPPTKHPPA